MPTTWALLGRAVMRSETFRQLAVAPSYVGDGYQLRNLNRLIGAYPGADGVKIGLTRAAGRTIVASATHDGHRVFVSLLRSQGTPSDSATLFDRVWRTFSLVDRPTGQPLASSKRTPDRLPIN